MERQLELQRMIGKLHVTIGEHTIEMTDQLELGNMEQVSILSQEIATFQKRQMELATELASIIADQLKELTVIPINNIQAPV